MSGTPRPGVLIERDDLSWLDTRELAWEPVAGRPGERRKPLVQAAAADGAPRVALLHLDPGASVDTSGGGTLLVLVLHGALAGAGAGAARPLGPGSFVHLGPGAAPDGIAAAPPTGCTCLVIRDSGGTLPGDPAPGVGLLLAAPGRRILDTPALAWEPVGRYGHCKVLVRDAEGRALLTLQHVAPDFSLPGHPTQHSHDHDQHDFVLWGEFPMAEFERESRRRDIALLRADHFIHRRAGEIHGLVADATSPTGCLTLQWYGDAAGRLLAGPGRTVDETEPRA